MRFPVFFLLEPGPAQRTYGVNKHYKNENDYGKDVTQGKLRQHANYIQALFQKILSEIQWDKMDTYLKR